MSRSQTLVDSAAYVDQAEAAPGSSPLRVGVVIGRYVLASRRGAGGMGVVWAAYDPELDRRVALKLLLPHRSGGEAARMRLLREAQALARLNHPNVVSIYDAGSWENQVWLAMEYIEGQTLGEWTRACPRDWREVLDHLRAAGLGLACAHAKSLVHRDFKPDNVMVGADTRVRVMDFGLARADGDEELNFDPAELNELNELGSGSGSGSVQTKRLLQSTLTVAGAMMGTPAYMAAELYRGGEADHRSDQFAFCVTAWELLYGRRPFVGKNLGSLSLAICEAERQAPPANAKVPAWLRGVLERGLDLDPARRWPSMDALLAALANDPSFRRRRIGTIVALSATLGAGVAWTQIVRARDHAQDLAQCERESEAAKALWDEPAQARVRAAMLDTGRAYAEDSWERTRVRIDTYVAQWSGARSRVCTASEIEASLDPKTSALATACLDQRRANFGALLELLGEGGDDSLRRAVESVTALPPIARCEDERWLHAQLPAPTPTIEAQADTLRTRLGHAAALSSLSRHAEAEAEAREVLAEAQDLAWEPLEARARIELGELLNHSGSYDEGAILLAEGFDSAASLGLDELATRAALGSSFVHSLRLGEYLEAERWAQLSGIFVRRSRSRGGLHDASQKSALSQAQVQLEQFDEALANAEAALELWRTLLGDEHPQVGRALNNLGTVQRSRGDRDLALATLQRALEIRESIYGPKHPDIAAPLNNLGTVFLQRGDYDVAYEHFLRALEIREDAYGPDHPATAFCLANVGTAQMRRSNHEAAITALERSIEIREGTLGPEHPHLASSLHNLGFVYLDLDQPARAIELFERALAIRVAKYGPNHQRSAGSMQALGRAQLRVGDPMGALPALLEAQAIFAKPGEDTPASAASHVYIAEARLALGELPAARVEIDAALAAYANSEGSPRERGSAQFVLAQVAWAQAQSERSAAALEQARSHYGEAQAVRALARTERWERERLPAIIR